MKSGVNFTNEDILIQTSHISNAQSPHMAHDYHIRPLPKSRVGYLVLNDAFKI